MRMVELDDIRVRYQDFEALKGVSLRIEPSEFIALLGPSGCGKTTLLRVLGGFIAYQGQVRVDGMAIDGIPSHRRNIGLVFQDYALFPHMTLRENVAFGPKMHRVPASEAADRVSDAIRLLRLEGLEMRYPNQLSGGQQQRVALARAIAINPALLLLDEPLGALDKKLREEMQVELRELQKRVGITTLFVTHDQEEALALADRVAVMSNGEIAQLGTPEEVYEQPRTRFVAEFIGRSNIVSATLDRESDAGWLCRLSGGDPIIVAAEQGNRAAPGESIVFSIRPEKLSLVPASADNNGHNAVAGILEHVTYLGTISQMRVRAETGQIFQIDRQNRRRAREEIAWSVGDRVKVTWDPADGVVLDESVTDRHPEGSSKEHSLPRF